MFELYGYGPPGASFTPREDHVDFLKGVLRNEHGTFASAQTSPCEELSFYFKLLSRAKRSSLSTRSSSSPSWSGAFFRCWNRRGQTSPCESPILYLVEEARRSCEAAGLHSTRACISARHYRHNCAQTTVYDEFDGVLGVQIDKRTYVDAHISLRSAVFFSLVSGRLLRLAPLRNEDGSSWRTRGRLYHKPLRSRVSRGAATRAATPRI